MKNKVNIDKILPQCDTLYFLKTDG